MTSVGDTPKVRLVSAGGEELPIVNNVKTAVKLSGIDFCDAVCAEQLDQFCCDPYGCLVWE